MRKTIFFIITLFMLNACLHKQHKLCQNYNGTLPAASSIGIDTSISFLPEHRYRQKDVYIGENNGTFIEEGSYIQEGNLITLIANNGEKTYYQLEDLQIRRLDRDKQKIKGSLADFYILKCN